MGGMFALMMGLMFLAVAFGTTLALAPSEAEMVVRKRVRDLATASADPDILEQQRLAEPFVQRVLAPVARRVQSFVWGRTPAATRERIAQRLVQAGRPQRPAAFVAQRVYGALIGFVLGLWFRGLLDGLPTVVGLVCVALMVYVGSIVPEMALGRRIQARLKIFGKAFPDVLDLLCVSVEAGLGFDGAVRRVSSKFSGPVAHEFEVYLRATRMGTPRVEALDDFSRRVGLPEVRNFVAAVTQAEKLGAPLTRVLRVQADDMRMRRKQKAQEQSMKAPIKLLFPLVIFIFPTIFIVLLGPAALQVMKIF